LINLARYQEVVKHDFVNAAGTYQQYIDDGGSITWSLAEYYEKGQGVKQNIDEYLRLLRLGADRGDGFAARRLAIDYLNGSYVDRDPILAKDLFERSIRYNVDGNAASYLAENYRDGRGVPRDMQKATYWLIFGAKLGDGRALSTLFELLDSGEARFREGFGPPLSFDNIVLLRALAEGNDADAQFKLAYRLEQSALTSGPDPNLSEAISWYRKAAANGNADAKSALKRLNAGENE
jgi:TPR repeat protein